MRRTDAAAPDRAGDIRLGVRHNLAQLMKIDLAGPRNRGLAMGLNEFAGYFAVAGAALATGWLAARYGLRPEPFYLGVGFVAVGLGLSVLLVRETRAHVAQEVKRHGRRSIGSHRTEMAHRGWGVGPGRRHQRQCGSLPRSPWPRGSSSRCA